LFIDFPQESVMVDQISKPHEQPTSAPLSASHLTENMYRPSARRSDRSEYLLKDTNLVIDERRIPLQSSDGHGWSNMAAVLTETKVLENSVPPVSSLFFAVPLERVPIIVEQDGHTYEGEMLPGSHGIIAPHIHHTVSLLRPSTIFYVFIKHDILQHVADEIYGKRYDDIDLYAPVTFMDPCMTHLLEICRHMLADPHDSGFRSDYVAQMLIAQFYAKHTQLRSTPHLYDSTAPLSERQLARVTEYLQANLHGEFQVADLAASIGLTRTIFFERFTHTTKYTPNQYLQSLRINKAKQLLRDRKLSLTEVAFACGYADQSHLSRFFKRCVGMSPGKYRKEVF
jgi:AraC family transcriptional regulator